jgi:hypothetical protein
VKMHSLETVSVSSPSMFETLPIQNCKSRRCPPAAVLFHPIDYPILPIRSKEIFEPQLSRIRLHQSCRPKAFPQGRLAPKGQARHFRRLSLVACDSQVEAGRGIFVACRS